MSIDSLCSSGTRTVSNAATSPRLLYVATSKNEGGLERYSVRLAQKLRDRRVSIRYACLPGEIIDRLCGEAGIETLPLRTRNSGDLRSASALAGQIAAHNIEIVHVHSRRDYLSAILGTALARFRTGKRIRLVLHAHLVRPLGEPASLNRAFFQKGTDTILAVSSAVQNAIEEAHNFRPGFVQVLHNGVDLEDFALPETAQAGGWRQVRRAEWNIPAAAEVIGMVGRLDAKGQASLLAAAPQILERHQGVYIVLVGPDGAPGEASRLAKRAQELGISERVILPGSRGDIPSVLAAFDLLAHLPADDALPGALIEAMAAGLPTVATNISGCAEIVRPEETGVLVPLDDPAAIVTAVCRLLEMEPSGRRRLGAAGRQVAESEFSLPGQIDRLQEIYRKLCPSPSQFRF